MHKETRSPLWCQKMPAVLANSTVLFFIVVVMLNSSVYLVADSFLTPVFFSSLRSPRSVSVSQITREIDHLDVLWNWLFGETIKKLGSSFLVTFLKHTCVSMVSVG